MAKHSKKRQRRDIDNEGSVLQPLGGKVSLIDDDTKDEEEKRLESLLFGTTFPPSTSRTKSALDTHETDQMDTNAGGGLGHLVDSDLFYIDNAGPSSIPDDVLGPISQDTTLDDDDEEGASRYSHSSGDERILEGLPIELDESSGATPTTFFDSRPKKTAVWADPDDANIQVSLASDKRLRKLRDAPTEDKVGGKDYEARLRRQYEKVHPVPQWASTARDRLHRKKRRRASQSSESEGEGSNSGEAITSLLSTSGGLLSSRRQTSLPQGQLSVERLRDANQSAKAEGGIRSVMFHPSPAVPVLMTASADRRLRLFNIDGHINPHLQSVHIPSLPITTAIFHPTGSSILITGHRPFYYSYDLQNGTCTQSPRGLWGTHAANPGSADLSMETCAFSRTGDILAVAGRRGYVHFVDWRRGGGQVVGSVKMNAGVKDVWWTGEDKLMSLGEDSEVYLWDVGEKRCVRRWKDDGGFGSVTMIGSRSDAYLAIGAKTGLVNLYGSESTSSGVSGTPKPLKTIGNLTTSISTMCFNHDAQILALASKTKKDQLKMVHLPSLTVFSNWPSTTTPLGHITSMAFSPGSEYAVVGNTRGRALLYTLRHFGQV